MGPQTIVYAVLAALSLLVIKRFIYVYFTYTDIPTLGPSGFFSTFGGMRRYFTNAIDVLEEGYRKYPNMAFKYYTSDGWQIFVSGEARLADMRKANDDQLSFLDHVNDITQIAHTMGHDIAEDMYHANVVKTTLTRNIAARFDDVRDELIVATEETIPPTNGWTERTILSTVMKIISRGANRMFLGLPFCRDQAFLDTNIEYTIQVVMGALVLRMFPSPLRPLIAKFTLKTNATYRKVRKTLEPMLQYRLDQEEKYGPDWEGKPNDYISWCLAIAQGRQRTIRDLVFRVLGINFAAIHTTSMSLTHAVLDVAANPQYLEPLREEIDSITKEEGWSKASVNKMRKLDSFLKESQRFWGLGTIGSGRRVMKPFTFSNGQTVPAGADVVVTTRSIHHDEEHYANAREFRPFRFSDIREEEGQGVFHQFVTPDPTFLAFGMGKHACPGRFFASNEIKLALAHLIVNYDMKFKDGTSRPPNLTINASISPDSKATVLFRKRTHA